MGDPGDVAPVGATVSELRIHHGPSYRVHFTRIGEDAESSSGLTEYQEYPSYEATSEPIAGLTAKVVTATSPEGFLAAVHMGDLDDDAPDLALTVWARCTDSVARQTAL